MARPFCTENYGTVDRLAEVQAIAEKGILVRKPPCLVSGTHLSTVIRRPERISRPHGLSPDEIRLAAQSAMLIGQLGLPLLYAVISDKNRPESEVRALTREFKSDVVQAQREARSPAWWLQVSEGAPAWHANILFPLGGSRPQRLAERLARSKLFQGDVLHIQPAEGHEWFVAYVTEERTPQAVFVPGVRMTKRKTGSHRNGIAGGDRVTVSKELRAVLEAGGIAPWRRTYRKRGLTPAPQPIEKPRVEVVAAGQLDLFALKPVARLRDFAHGHVPPAVALEIEFRRKRAGMTQRQLARRAGISQPQLANIVAGRFGLTAWSASRLREALAA